MSVLGTVRELLRGPSTARDAGGSDGAYWCHDCEERVRDVEVEGEEPPACPSCGDDMTFERSVGTSNCAC